jgi:hypothetical protein
VCFGVAAQLEELPSLLDPFDPLDPLGIVPELEPPLDPKPPAPMPMPIPRGGVNVHLPV